MTNQEILRGAIEKAVENGYEDHGELLLNWHTDGDRATRHFRDYVFSHDFAKAFWGDEKHNAYMFDANGAYNCTRCGGDPLNEGKDADHDIGEIEWCWQYHLQQMVLEEDPLKYLAKFL